MEDEIDLLDEAVMGWVRPDIFDGSLSVSEYDYQKDEYQKYAKPMQEYLREYLKAEW